MAKQWHVARLIGHDDRMKITHSVRYAAPPAAVHAMLTDPAFREKASWAQSVTQVSVKAAGNEIRTDMHQPHTDIPGALRKYAGETTNAHQDESSSAPSPEGRRGGKRRASQ